VVARPSSPSTGQLELSLVHDDVAVDAEGQPSRRIAPVESGARLIRPEQAAVLLGIGRTKLYELMARGELESVTIDRRRLVPVDAVEEFVQRLRVSAARG
jgi:excisionase family DNA binding protein